MDRLLTLLISLCVAAGGMYAWDRHPPVSFQVPLGPFRPTFSLPPSLAQERDEALAEAERLASANRTCMASIAEQNAAIEAQRERGKAAAKEAEKALAKALQGKASADAKVSRLLAAKPAGDTVCERMESVDDAVLEALK